MIAGEWTGTMNLTEPQCGTDLGLLRTKAVPQADGSYTITGTEDLHLGRRARPRRRTSSIWCSPASRARRTARRASRCSSCRSSCVNADGSLGARNGVVCGSIEQKMGIHGNATCVMNYDGATGWLVGEENKGLHAMFTMMNEARLGVGMQGLALSEVAYQNAAAYARDRLQGRSLTGVEGARQAGRPDHRPSGHAPHADRDPRLQRGRARASCSGPRCKGDVAHRSADAKERQAADDHMGLMTPVVKGVLTDNGFANAVQAQQVFGGHGYIAEHGMEQFVRDARIAMIYEGANGIQALDLVGRKLPTDGGRAIMAFFSEVAAFIKENGGDAALKPFVDAAREPRSAICSRRRCGSCRTPWRSPTMPAPARPTTCISSASSRSATCGRRWRRRRRPRSPPAAPTARALTTKLVDRPLLHGARCCRRPRAHLARITAGADTIMALPAEAF